MSKKKILIFSLVYFPDFIGGAEIAVKEITDRLGGEIDFHMVTLKSPSHLSSVERVGKIEIHRILGFMPLSLAKLLFPFAAYIKATRLHRREHFDQTWSIMAAYAGFAALFFKWFHPTVRFSLTLQEGDPIAYILKRVRFVYPLFKNIFKKADATQAISQYLSNWAKDMGARPPIRVIPNGVDVMHFGSWKALGEQAKLKNELGIKGTDRVLITTSRLVEKNAVGDIIEALLFLEPDTKLLVLGTGPLEAKLKSRVLDLQLSESVRFVGHVSHEKLPDYLQISSIFIRPSLSEGMGNSFIEAMAVGLPVIATKVGGIPDFLKDKETGLFCAVHDPKDIARKVTILLRDEAIRTSVIENAKKMVAEKYDWNFVAKQMKQFFLTD